MQRKDIKVGQEYAVYSSGSRQKRTDWEYKRAVRVRVISIEKDGMPRPEGSLYSSRRYFVRRVVKAQVISKGMRMADVDGVIYLEPAALICPWGEREKEVARLDEASEARIRKQREAAEQAPAKIEALHRRQREVGLVNEENEPLYLISAPYSDGTLVVSSYRMKIDEIERILTALERSRVAA